MAKRRLLLPSARSHKCTRHLDEAGAARSLWNRFSADRRWFLQYFPTMPLGTKHDRRVCFITVLLFTVPPLSETLDLSSGVPGLVSATRVPSVAPQKDNRCPLALPGS